MTRSPLFSIVVPCYNSSNTLAETVASVQAQTIADFELVIVDDGSTDDSAGVARRLAATDERIIVVTQRNGGVSTARNHGIRLARGAYVALLDADDVWVPEFLAVHEARFQADPKLGLSFSPVRFMEADGRVTHERSRPQLSGFSPADILSTNPCTTCSTIVVRKQVFDDVGLFRESLRRAEDQEWLFRVALSPWKIEGASQILVYYRNSPNGLSANLDGMYEGFRAMLEAARESAPELVGRAGPLAAARMLRYLARRALRLDLDRTIARAFIVRALTTAPKMLLKEPKQTIATLIAALVPGVGGLLFSVLRRT
jgi:glycosyltransferase involved in cell wall biosynthesis